MISKPSLFLPAIFAVASHRVSSRPRARRMLVSLFTVLAVLGGAMSIASAQTAHFSGSAPTSWVQSTLPIPDATLPGGIAVDGSGSIYLAINDLPYVAKFTPSQGGGYTSGTIGGGLGAAVAIAVDGSGNVYISDCKNQQVVKETPSSNGYIQSIVASLSTNGSGAISQIAVDGAGNVYIVNYGDTRVLKETPSASGYTESTVISGMQYGISSIAADAAGNIYLTDYYHHGAVKETLSSGVYSQSTIGSGSPNVIPTAVAVDGNGNVYFAGSTYTYIAGTVGAAFAETLVDGYYMEESALNIGKTLPNAIAVDSSGNVYISGSNNTGLQEESPIYGNVGPVNLGSTSAIKMIFTFDTAGTLSSTAVLTQGAIGMDFTDMIYPDTCAAKTEYAAGQSCTVYVNFTPKLAGTRNGTVVLYDTAGNAIARGSMQGVGVGPQISFLPGGSSTVASGFVEPYGVAVDNNGNVYVSNDTAVYEIHAVNGSIPASPTVTTLISTGGRYTSVAVDANGNLYLPEYPGTSVIEVEAVNGVIPASPTVITLASSFDEPEGVAVDRNGNVYVADWTSIHEILAVNGSIPASPTIVTLATENCVLGNVAVDGNGNVYFGGCNSSLMEIEAINGSVPASPTIRTLATNANPLGIAIDGGGNVFFSDNGNGYVSEILAINGSVPASPTTVRLADGFDGADGLALDGNGNVYVADFFNNRIAKLNFSVPPSLAFAETPIGTTSADSPQTVTISNVGNAPLTFPIPLTGSNPSIPANFFLNENGASACPLVSAGSPEPGTLQPGASCELPISFTPATTGSLSGSMVLTDNNLNAATPGYAPQSITMTGYGYQPAPSFTLGAPAAVTLNSGGSSTSTISVIPQYGFTGSVTLTVYGLPAGVTGSFSPNPTTGTSALTLTASGYIAAGTYTVTIMGRIPPVPIAYTTFTLTVITQPIFALTASPNYLELAQGGFGASGITVVPYNGFNGSVDLSISGLPIGVSASFNPNPTAGASVLTLTANSSVTLGDALVTLTGTSGSLTVSSPLFLTVSTPVVTALSPASFGQTNIGASSPVVPIVFTFVNGGSFGSITVLTQGAAGLDFADAGSDTCTANTAYTAGQSCTVNVTFTPMYAGARYGAVVLNDNNGNAIATPYLQGTGVGAQINFLPNSESTVASLSTGLSEPYAVAVDGSGNIYVADAGNAVILKESPTVGGYTQSSILTSSLNNPTGVAVDGSGNVYIADTGTSRVLKEAPSAAGYTESVVVDSPNNGIMYPNSVAVDGSGNVYFFGLDVANVQENLYEETPSAGGYIQSTIPYSGVSSAGSIAVDGNGNVYIADTGNGQVIKEAPSASGYLQSTVPTNGLIQPYGIAVDGVGNIYVADEGGGSIFKETQSAGNYIQSTVSTSTLNWPTGVAVDAGGNVYIADSYDYRMLKEDFADAPSLSFATTTVGSISPDSPQTVMIENVGNATLSFPIPSSGNNPGISANFSLNSGAGSACPQVSAGSSTAGTLAAGASCQLPVSFTPTTVGALNGALTLTDNNLNAAAPGYATQSILLSGTATQATPTITWATPAAITYGMRLSHWQLNATSTVAGTFTYSPAAGTVLGAGQQTLTVTFTPTDTTDYTTATATVALAVSQATPPVFWPTPAAITYGTPLSQAQLNARSMEAGSFIYSPAAGTVLNAGPQSLMATFTPADSTDYTTATASVNLMVNKAKLTIGWAVPAAIPYGTALSATQLDATSMTSGNFVYSPPAGTILSVGSHTLSAIFTPSNPANYTTPSATATVTLAVYKATPATAWATPAAITYGTSLSATQLNATSTVAGTFVYSPAAGTVLNAGQQTLRVTFTPTNTTDYTTSTASVTLTVNKATPSITWSTPRAITYGTALSATQLNATSAVAGSLAYLPVTGTILNAGQQTLRVTFTPTDKTNYTTSTASVTLTVNKATPSITWTTPRAITYGTALSATQMNATSTVAGTFTYFLAAGTVLAAGNHTLTATMTPTNTTNYTTATAMVTLTVNR